MLPSDFTVRAFQARISVATARPMAPKKNAAANAALAAANALRKPQARCPQAPCGCAPDGSVEKGFMNKHHLALHLALRHELEPGTIRNLLYKDPAMITNMRLPRDTTASVTGDCRNMTIEDLEQLVELFPDTQACKFCWNKKNKDGSLLPARRVFIGITTDIRTAHAMNWRPSHNWGGQNKLMLCEVVADIKAAGHSWTKLLATQTDDFGKEPEAAAKGVKRGPGKYNQCSASTTSNTSIPNPRTASDDGAVESAPARPTPADKIIPDAGDSSDMHKRRRGQAAATVNEEIDTSMHGESQAAVAPQSRLACQQTDVGLSPPRLPKPAPHATSTTQSPSHLEGNWLSWEQVREPLLREVQQAINRIAGTKGTDHPIQLKAAGVLAFLKQSKLLAEDEQQHTAALQQLDCIEELKEHLEQHQKAKEERQAARNLLKEVDQVLEQMKSVVHDLTDIATELQGLHDQAHSEVEATYDRFNTAVVRNQVPLFSLQTILSLIQRRTGYTVRGWSDCSWALDQKASTADVRLSADSPDPHRQGVAERLEKVRRDATLAFEQKQLTEAEHAADDFPVILSPSPTGIVPDTADQNDGMYLDEQGASRDSH
ncbi:MAG: hypothetical protein FRX49_06697 [Trebouxia sp. A1-2]|nr:MAG: hypothetical protein FRX49_06697 [Trebouxia sp. A1-2]